MDYLIIAALVGEILILSRLDRRIFGTWYTPFNLLAYPYAGVVLCAFLFAPVMDFVRLYVPSVLIWIIGLFVFWVGGFVLGWGVFGLNSTVSQSIAGCLAAPNSETQPRSVAWAIRASWILAPVLLWGLLSTLQKTGGLIQFGSPEYRGSYSHGFHAHIVVLSLAAIILLVGDYRSGQKLQLFTVGMLMVFVFASEVKGAIFQPIIGGLIFRAFRGRFRLSAKWVFTVISCSLVTFVLVYMVAFWVADVNSVTQWDLYSSLSRHYFFYLFAGPLSLSEAIRMHSTDVGGDWYTIFSPFINLYRATLGAGPLVGAGSFVAKGMDIDPQLDRTLGGANVYTFFGTTYLYLGIFGGLLYILIASILCYALLIYVKHSGNEWVLAGYGFIVAQLFFGFFELYFWYLTFIELLVFAFILASISKWPQKRTQVRDSETKVRARRWANGTT